MRRHISLGSHLAYALAIIILAWPALADAGQVTVILSEESAVYREVAETIRSRLAGAATVDIVDVAGVASLKRSEPRFLVAVGSQAARSAMAGIPEAPLLVTLLPKTAIDRLEAERRRSNGSRPLSAVYLDQPIERQLDFIRLAMPDARRIGVLLGPESGKLYPVLQGAAIERQLKLVAQWVEQDGDLAPALQKILPDIDIMLALPDPSVFNAGTIQLILLGTYRQRLPLFGFSAAYVRAGAVASLHSMPAQIGAQAADMLHAALARGHLPPPQYPRQYTIATNPHVARSLSVAIESEEALIRRMGAQDAR